MFTAAQKRLFDEANRRFYCFAKPEKKRLEDAWVGLGHMSTYRPVVDAGLMAPTFVPAPRCMTWFKLTPDGVKAFRKAYGRAGTPVGYDGEPL